jgi:hypothetical protein
MHDCVVHLLFSLSGLSSQAGIKWIQMSRKNGKDWRMQMIIRGARINHGHAT